MPFLDAVLFSLGGNAVTALRLLEAVGVVLIAWLVSRIVQKALIRLSRRGQPSFRPMFYTVARLSHYFLLLVGFLVGLTFLGIDVGKFTLFMSALGVGLGFGMQQVVNNFISGVILLFEQSIKVGDFVELEDGVAGMDNEISLRSTRITTNDNIDVIVPNSMLVSGKVTNWTLRDVVRRVRIPFGVAYGSDKELVKKAGLEAAAAVPFTLNEPASRGPQVWLVGFGDSSLNFELVVWLTPEATKRPATVHAAYCWAIATALAKYGIEIPFPQRDLHVRSVLGHRDLAALQATLHDRQPAPAAAEPAAAELSERERDALSRNDALSDMFAPPPPGQAKPAK